MFEWINVFFMNALNWIYGWVGNYGWAVVIFTLLTRLVLMPLDVKSRRSMRATSQTTLSPKWLRRCAMRWSRPIPNSRTAITA